MLKLLIVLPMLLIGVALLGAGALVFLPLLAVLPVVLAAGAILFAFVFAMGIFAPAVAKVPKYTLPPATAGDADAHAVPPVSADHRCAPVFASRA